MTHPEPVFDPRVIEALKRAKDLPSIPAVALEVLRVAQDEDAGAEDLASVVCLDPVLAARVLKAANSVLFCGVGEITTLRRACSRLGFRTVKLMTLSLALVDSFDRRALGRFDHDQYWKRSIVRAVSARLLAEAGARSVADEAFMVGLLSRIGQLLLASCLPREYDTVLAACEENWPSVETEKRQLGFGSVEVGAALLHSWSIPPLIYRSMLHTQETTEEGASGDPAQKLGRILSLATLCEELVCEPGNSKHLAEIHERMGDHFGMDAARINDLLSQVESRTAEMAEILNVKIEGQLQIAEILREAQEEVLQETLAVLQSAVVTERRATQLEQEKSQLLVKVHTDALTGLANRSLFEDYLASCFAPGKERLPVGLLMIDIDNFKQVNDVYGHRMGDEVLRLVAATIREITRQSDVAARYGGEEFAVIVSGTPLKALQNIAERIRLQIESRRFVTEQGHIPITVSIGGAHSDLIEDPPAAEALLKVADRYLYDAKRAGRNRCMFAPVGAVAGDKVKAGVQTTRSR
jgi:diguanylate cyclase (GGDEF)-like protein